MDLLPFEDDEELEQMANQSVLYGSIGEYSSSFFLKLSLTEI